MERVADGPPRTLADLVLTGFSDAHRIDFRSIVDFGLRHGEINRAVGAFLRGLPPV